MKYRLHSRLSRNLTVFFLIWIFGACQQMGEPPEEAPESSSSQVEKNYGLGGAPIKVKLQLSTDVLSLTDYLTLTITVEYTDAVVLVPPYLTDKTYAPLMLVEKPREEIKWAASNDFMIGQWTYRFEPMSSGKFEIAAFDVFFRLEKERSTEISNWPVYQIATEAIPYQVAPAELSGDDIREIKGLILPAFNYIPLWITVGIIVLLLALVVGVYTFLARKHPAATTSQPEANYAQIALDALKLLEQDSLIEKKQFETLHTKLAGILREYLENYFHLRAQEQTTEEFIREISQSRRFSGDQRNLLQDFLKLADMVKFATFDPGAQISQDALRNIQQFVTTTGRVDGI